MFIACSRGCIDEEVIERAPFDVFEELFDKPVFFRTAPYNGGVAGGEHELHGHYAEVVGYPDGTPARVANVDCFIRGDAHH